MITRSLAVAAATVFVSLASAVHAAPQGSLETAILGCAAQADEKAQLACYNRIAAQLKAPSPAAPQAAVQTAPPVVQPERSAAPPARTAVIGTPADFGKEGLRFQADEPAVLDHITARVVNVTYNYFHIFTVTLDNGQVWRQVDGDTRIARFKNDKTEIVTISRGFLDSFNLVIRGLWGDYAVKRIK